MKEMIRTLVYYLYSMMPKFNHAVVWGWPVGEDSSRILVEKLQETCLKRVILLVTNVRDSACLFEKCGRKAAVVNKRSLSALWWFLTARYVFFTHRCFMRRFPKRVVSVNIWHGMPFKKIGWMLDGNEGIGSRHVLATSAFWAPVMQQAMRPSRSVLVTGLPRNDRLFSDRGQVLLKLGLSGRTDVAKIIAWLPTYRKSVRGEIRADGHETGSVFGIDAVTPVELNSFCKAHHVFIWVKPHPMSAFEHPVNLSHLIVMDDDGLSRQGLSLYELLGASDALISDISSVVIDFLLLDRPIIHCFPDLDAYRCSRGFTLEPVENYFAGPVATSFTEVIREIERLLQGDDPSSARRRLLCDLFHEKKDGTSTERLLAALNIPRQTVNLE